MLEHFSLTLSYSQYFPFVTILQTGIWFWSEVAHGETLSNAVIRIGGGAFTPDMYHCAVAVAPVSDLVAQVKWDRKQEGSDSEVYKYVTAHIGHPRRDKMELNAHSPARLAEHVRRPILLVHGKGDGVVPIEQTEIMEEALRKAGKAVTTVILEDSSHSYRSDADERIEYEAILAFLATHLPTDPPVGAGENALP